MSEVYKATHTEDGRTVAIRVIPPEWAGPADFPRIKQRFEQQAEAVATLAHPNIAKLYEIGQSDNVDFVVTEFVEGETLAARLERGPLPLPEAMQVALAIGDALDKAHRAGIVHRHLTPANIMLTESGAKLVDLGLGELRPSAAAAVPKASVATVSAVQKPGVDTVLQYSAPELFDGKPADTRSDIFAYGAILYEMVTGRKAFEGKSRAVLIAVITTAEPDPLTRVTPAAPRALEHAIGRCLEKDPADRCQTAHDLMVRLRWITDGGAPLPVVVETTPEKPSLLSPIKLAAAAVVIAALAVPAALYFRGSGEQARFQFRVPAVGISSSNFSISPDGKTLALVARPESEGAAALYTKKTGGLAFVKLLGTDDAAQPFWSPDSRFIAFVAKGRLKKVSVGGGAPQDIAEAASFAGGTWSEEGTILFGSEKGLYRVSAEGGKPAPVSTISDKQSGHYFPDFLPGGKHYLYLAWSMDASARAIYTGSLEGKEKTRLLTAASNAVYAAPGYVLFHRDSSLFAQKFDANSRTLSGEPLHIADEVFANPANGRGSFAASQNGALVYFQGVGAPAGRAATSNPARFAWHDRAGGEVDQAGVTGAYGDMDVSPDGKLIALTRQDPGIAGADIWVMDWKRAGVMTRLTLDPADDINPVWSNDGTRIAFTTYRKGNADIYVRNANGSGGETPLLDSTTDEMIEDWSKDGRFIAYLSGQNNTPDIYALPLTGDKKPIPLVQGNFKKNEPQFSYDGKWLAYTSDESGKFQVYVMSFPDGAQRLQVSTEGGGQPRWRRDGRELFFRMEDGGLMVVDMQTSGKLESGVPRLLFAGRSTAFSSNDPVRHMTSVTGDGQRFLVRALPQSIASSAGAPFVPTFSTRDAGGGPRVLRQQRGGFLGDINNGLTVIQHWTAGLEAR